MSRKADFAGSWSHSVELVSLEAGEDWLDASMESPPTVVTWSIERSYLFAVREGGDPEDAAALTASFPIESHFFVSTCYTPVTSYGDDGIILASEPVDAPPWYERPFVRVDWTSEVVGNRDVLGLGDEGELETMPFFDQRWLEDASWLALNDDVRDEESLVLESFARLTGYILTAPHDRCERPEDDACTAVLLVRHRFERLE